VRVVWGNPEGSRLNLYEVGLDPVTTDPKGKAQFPPFAIYWHRGPPRLRCCP